MPMLATLYHHDNGTAPSPVALTSHGGHYLVEPIVSGCSSDVMQARDGIFPGAVTTTGAEGSTSIESTSIISTGGIDLG